MKIAIGNDHGGVALKQHLVRYLEEKGFEVVNFGSDVTESTDYPIYAERVGRAVVSGECDRGILICGTGIGISISANKIHGVRCALCSEPVSARLSREHNDANIVAMGARTIGFMWIQTDNSAAEVGYSLSRDYWDRGIMTEALKAVIGHGFGSMNLNRIEAQHETTNPASGAVMRKCGMQREGTLRQRLYNKGRYVDVELYAILRKEYEHRKK